MTRYPYYERIIHYYETDRMGVVHHSNYARILEDCRIDMMAYYGLPYAELERMGYMINLQVIPGNTIFVKSQLMTVFSDQIFSCIADDNSILMVLRSEETAKDIFEQVKNW